jgi:hypothetical protein
MLIVICVIRIRSEAKTIFDVNLVLQISHFLETEVKRIYNTFNRVHIATTPGRAK